MNLVPATCIVVALLAMADHLTLVQRRRAMQRVKSKDGPLETAVRSALWRKGFRFRKHVKTLPGKPDLVFTRVKVVVFIDGDFWHGYRFHKWEAPLKPYWREKIAGNRSRDCRNFLALRKMGWRVVRVWGHSVKHDLEGVVDRIIKAYSKGPRYTGTDTPNS